MEMNAMYSFGYWFENIIIYLADKAAKNPGMVSIYIMVFATTIVFWITIKITASIYYICKFKKIIHEENKGANKDVAKYIRNKLINEGGRGVKKFMLPAWERFEKFIYKNKEYAGGGGYFASIVPNNIFGREVFRIPVNFWRVLPNLFVSIGLLLTFLGLIAALHQFRTENGGGINPAVMSNFLRIASAKFIMSVTGLGSSIFIIIITRLFLGIFDKKILSLNDKLSEIFPYKSLEEIVQEQLQETREQREYLQKVAFEVAAEIARPLREDVPQAIGESIRNELQPILRSVQAQGTEGVQEMVGTLSEQLTQEVGNALSDASGRLELAAQKLSEVAETLAANVRTMGEGLSEQARLLTDSVAGIRGQMAEGLQLQMQMLSEQIQEQLSQTAGFLSEETGKLLSDSRESLITPLQDMAGQLLAQSERLNEVLNSVGGQLEEKARESAAAMQAQVAVMEEGLQGQAAAVRQSLQVQTEELQRALQKAGAEIARDVGEAARGVLSTAQAEVLPPLRDLAGQLQRAAEATRNGASGFSEVVEGLKSGARAAHDAAGAFRQSAEAVSHSSGALEKTFEAFRQSHESALQRFTQMAQAIENGARMLETTVQETRKALAAEQQSLATALKELETVIAATEDYRGDLKDLDEKIANALKHYDQNIEQSLEKIRETVRQISEDLESPLTILREVVQQVEQFKPRQQQGG